MEGECAYIITRWMKAGFVDYEGKQYKKIANSNDKTKTRKKEGCPDKG